MIPESALQSEALASAGHAVLRILAVLVCGKTEQSNGRLACSDSYARQFGITSHQTLTRSLRTLQERGLIVCTRRVARMRRHLTLYAVTWWPIYSRDGYPVNPPEPATREYLKWRKDPPAKPSSDAPTIGGSRPRGEGDKQQTSPPFEP